MAECDEDMEMENYVKRSCHSTKCRVLYLFLLPTHIIDCVVPPFFIKGPREEEKTLKRMAKKEASTLSGRHIWYIRIRPRYSI